MVQGNAEVVDCIPYDERPGVRRRLWEDDTKVRSVVLIVGFKTWPVRMGLDEGGKLRFQIENVIVGSFDLQVRAVKAASRHR
jgi:hypothetical protein